MKEPRTTKKINIEAVDLFCGAGGLTKGLAMAGINVKVGVDYDEACEFPYTYNNSAEFIEESVENINADVLETYLSKRSLRLLAGCAPCQTFSTYNQKASRRDKRWWLLREFSRIVRELEPEFVTMENVPKLSEHKVFKDFVKMLEEMRYHVDCKIVECKDYGIPQQRRRLVLLASKFGPLKLVPPTVNEGPKTVKEAIGNLPPIKHGEMYLDDPLHQCSLLSPLNLCRIKASRPGGTWRDWKKELVADCHKKKSGKTYPGVYGRMKWEEPSPTITTQFFGFGNGRFGHPEQNRAISLREGAILQSFPEDYIFAPPDEPIFKKTVGRLIGNAVPVKLGEVIGRSIIDHLKLYKRKRTSRGNK